MAKRSVVTTVTPYRKLIASEMRLACYIHGGRDKTTAFILRGISEPADYVYSRLDLLISGGYYLHWQFTQTGKIGLSTILPLRGIYTFRYSSLSSRTKYILQF